MTTLAAGFRPDDLPAEQAALAVLRAVAPAICWEAFRHAWRAARIAAWASWLVLPDPTARQAWSAACLTARVGDVGAGGQAGALRGLFGKLAIANAKLAYQSYLEIFSGADWEELMAAGASPQRCLWASTSAKNPNYRDVVYVEQLIGPDTVNTMPRETIEALQDHGQVSDTLERDVDAAHETFERFADAGVDYDDVVAVLEREGVEKFAKSFQELFDGVAAKREQFVPA